MSRNVDILLPVFLTPPAPPPPPTVARHEYSIVTGERSGIFGYWFNNIGNITDSSYALPNSVTAIIRQTMYINGKLRYLVSSGGVSTSSPDQFPSSIEIIFGGSKSIFDSPEAPASYGQGIGRDYAHRSGSASASSTIGANGRTLQVRIID